jgi:prepilin-type N-terminal cleavage/methylation domain-containing protein
MKGFTLLEMILASALSGVLVLACLGLLAALDRTDQAMSIRHQQAQEMATLHLAMERTFGSLLMAREADIQQESQNRSGIIAGVEQRPSRPRLLLANDPAVSAPSGAAAPQRLEVVLSRAPLPPGFGRDEVPTDEEAAIGGPMRGVFELRPEGDAWAMWWRPLPRDENQPDGHLFSTDPRNDPRAVRVAGNLRQAQWLAFKKRERHPEVEAKLVHDLPAHMELNVQMTSGYAAQWMFEVAWMNGPETAEEQAAEEEAAAAEPAATGRRGGAGGGGGGGGGPGGTGTRGGQGRPPAGFGSTIPGANDIERGIDTPRRNVATPAPGSDRGGRR